MGHFHRAAAGIDHLERLGRRSSPIHRLAPFSKLIVTVLYIFLVVSIPQDRPELLGPFFLYPAVMMSLSGTPWRPLISRLGAALPFALAIGITNIILMGEPVFTVGALVITRGMVSCGVILLKTALCVFAALLLIATTPFTGIAAVLTLGPARPIGLQIVLTYRYIATLLEEAGDAWTAYMLRAPGQRGIKLKDMGTFLGGLLLRSFDKAERVYYGMKCRGFEGAYHGVERARAGAAEGAFILISGAALVVMRIGNPSLLLGRWFWRLYG